jgi:hypothetical protein
MGESHSGVCSSCGHRFTVSVGGGFTFHLLHCDQCGRGKTLAFDRIGELHLGYVKGLRGPYSIATAAGDVVIQREYRGKALTEADYQAAVEAKLRKCKCGGRFTFAAVPRCPKCRSAELMDDPEGPFLLYD